MSGQDSRLNLTRHSVDDERYQELLAAEAEVERLSMAQDEPIITADDIIESLRQQLRGAVAANDDAFQVICDALSALQPPQARELMETLSYKAFAAFYKPGQ